MESWQTQTPNQGRMYMIVLTGLDGSRTFCYCQRVRPEGSDFSLPLAVCILSRHKDRLLFQQILSELTVRYGSTQHPTAQAFRHLFTHSFAQYRDNVTAAQRRASTSGDQRSGTLLHSAPDVDTRNLCSLLSAEQIWQVYAHVLLEKKLVVRSPSLSDLTLFFDGLDALLSPHFAWQHSIIPAMPDDRQDRRGQNVHSFPHQLQRKFIIQ